MVVNEKALMRCMKEAYKHQGYTVTVYDGWMVINGGYWLVRIAEEETSNELRSLIILHMRDLPQEGQAFKTIKGDCGPIVQQVMLSKALESLGNMEAKLVESMGDNGPVIIRRSPIRYDGAVIWQNAADLAVLAVDPRYEALLESHKDVQRVGTGLYKDDMVSTAWILGIYETNAIEKMDHLAKFRWVHA